MVQQSVTKSKVSETVTMPQSVQQQNSVQSQGKTYSQKNHQQARNKKKRIPSIEELLHQQGSSTSPSAPNSAPAQRQKSVAPKINGKSRSQFVDLPPNVVKRSQQATRIQRGNADAFLTDEELTLMKVKPPQSLKKRTQRQRSRSGNSSSKRRRPSIMLYALRLLILGVGISAIAGTILSVLDPTTRITGNNTQTNTVEETQPEEASNEAAVVSSLKLSQEISPLKTVVQQLVTKNSNLMPGIFFVDLDTGAYLNLNGETSFAAASTIKFPILVAFFQDVDAGKIQLDEKLTLKKEQIGGGSGDIQYKTPGTKFTALEVATKMIVISDNTATNMLIERLGGMAALNQRFESWGLQTTQLRNLLPDLPGTNTTSPKELGQLMAMVNQGDLMSLKSRDRLLHIMQQTRTATLLPRGLGKGATIAHKTGDIGSMVGDVGLIDMPSGKRYIAVVMVKRPHNDHRAQELIRQVSRAAYQQFDKPTVSEVMPTTPFVTTTPVGR